MKMKFILYLTLLILMSCSLTSYAQVSIGLCEKPVDGALLQIKEHEIADGSANSKGGLAMPRVKLTSKTNLYPMFETTVGSGIANGAYNDATKKITEDDKHIGLMVYHTDYCTMQGNGLYVWNGAEWQSLNEEVHSLAGMAKALGTDQDQIADNGVAWHKDHEGNIFFSMNFDASNPTGNNNRWMTSNLATKTYGARTDNTVWTPPILTNSYSRYPSPYNDACWGYPNTEGTIDAGLSTTFDANQRVGLLYNYAAATANQNTSIAEQGGIVHMGVQGICPQGWHLPTDLEWTQLENEIIKNTEIYSSTPNITAPLLDNTSTGWRGTHGKAMGDMCEPSIWENSTSYSLLNRGFSAMFVGNANDGSSNSLGIFTNFWASSSSSSSSNTQAWRRGISKERGAVHRGVILRYNLISVRCKKNN